jgi:hypothetical protein
MADQVRLPGIGEVDRRWLYAGGALVAGIVGYAWWQRSRGTAPAEAGPAIDPLTGLPVDPQTGTGGYVNPRPVQSVIDGTNPDEIRTNVQWTQAVTDKLTLLGSWDAGFIATTLGKYLANQPLNPDEQALVRTAWAYAGKPPEGPAQFVPAPTGGGGNNNPPPGGGGGNNNPPVQGVYENVTEGMHVDPWLAAIQAIHGATEGQIAALNPTLWGPQLITASKPGVGYVPPGTPGSFRTFGSNQRIRVK